MTGKPENQTTRKRRQRSKPSTLAVQALLRMPFGELTRTAAELVARDRDTAAFLVERLNEELGNEPPAAGAEG